MTHGVCFVALEPGASYSEAYTGAEVYWYLRIVIGSATSMAPNTVSVSFLMGSGAPTGREKSWHNF